MKLYKSIIPLILLISGLYLVPVSIMKPDLSMIPGDLGDARFNNYVLEHGHRFIMGTETNYWNARFMYPYKNIIASSDNLLGTLPIYSLFRITGINRETSFQLWLISLFALNFICCFFVLKSWSNNTVLSSVGAYVFAFSIFTIGQLNHVQVFPRFMVPLLIYWMYKYMVTKEIRFFLFTGLGLTFQFYCGIYLGIFSVTSLAFLVIGYLLVYRDKTFFTQFSKGRVILYHQFIIIGCYLLLYPLIAHYTVTSDQLGFFEFAEAKLYIPEVRSYFFANDGSYTWKIFSTHSLSHFKMYWNNYLFPGILPFSGIVLIPFAIFSQRISKSKKQLILFVTITLFLSLLFHLKFGEFTLYEYIFRIPGFSSIRSVDRVVNVQIFFFILLMVFTLNEFLTKNKYSRILFAVLPILVVADNLIIAENAIKFSKHESQDRTKALVKLMGDKPDERYQAMAYLPFNNLAPEQYKLHLDAMIACQELNYACLNAYTGKFPGSYADFFSRLDYQSLVRWCNDNQINRTRVLTVNELGDFVQVHPVAFIRAANNLFLSTEGDSRIIADKPHRAQWEEYNILRYPSGTHIIRTYDNNFLHVDTLNGYRVKYQMAIPQLGNGFQAIYIGDSSIAFRDAKGKYLQVHPDDKFIYADSDSINLNCVFKILN